ncbi:hypothetical protein BDP27DRAFT_1380833 [Rhodocollybia butyracea]|uniref:Transmembrane protein n=1 Tax=Rhodocollybia butyracea TaxID=206335 RepID=A0A9P5Q5Y7_9AGAR|nr:hypothetical protein BDP27DRAFT_1380833 [Rhodocollybia butyracea]
MSSIEMEDLSVKKKNENKENLKTLDLHEAEMDDAASTWTIVAALLLVLFAAILTLSPQFLLFLSTDTPSTMTSLERFLSVHFGIWLFTIAVALVLNIPSSSPLPLGFNQPGHPLLKPFTFAALFSSIISYNTRSVGSLASIHCVIIGVVGLWGLWVHTSAFIFGNKSASSKQKKEWSKNQKTGHGS